MSAAQTSMVFNYDTDEGGWERPLELPNLVGCKVIALDTETYDPNLMERGAGWAFGDGHIIGVSVAVEDGKWYIPVLCATVHDGFSIQAVIEWVNKVFTDDVLMVGANLMYDLGWLKYHGAELRCKTFDVQFAAPLLDEHKHSYSLESIADSYDIKGKDSNALYYWCAANFGGKPDGRQRAHIHQAPLRLVGPYAEQDAALPLEIMALQMVELQAQDLVEVCEMENALTHMLVAMRMRGVRVDMGARSKLSDSMVARRCEAMGIITDFTGYELNVNAPTELARVFDQNNWEYPLTEKTKAPSFKVGFLRKHESDFAKAVAEVKRINKLHGTFVDGYFSLANKGRLHCNLHPLRTSTYGTVSGRFACSSPNLQNIPSRDPIYGRLIRGLFIPDEGEDWVSIDYSSIELRMLAHYAIGKGADEVRTLYNKDPNTDFHKLVMDKTGLERAQAKTVSFSLCYGSGVQNTADLLECTPDKAKAFREKHFAGVPFMKATLEECMFRAAKRGWIRTTKGRIARFSQWEPANWDLSQELGSFDTKQQCIDEIAAFTDMDNVNATHIKRARTYKALNSLLQGSSADLMKQAMVNLWNDGVLDTVGVPMLTVHDELNFSVARTKEAKEGMEHVRHLMETAIKFRVPVKASMDSGVNWGEAH